MHSSITRSRDDLLLIEALEKQQCRTQSQDNAVHTPAGFPLALLTIRSTKLPAATAMLPVAVQLPPEAVGEHVSAVLTICPGVPTRSVTSIGLACCENTISFVAVQPTGTHVKTGPVSNALALELFTE